MAGDGSPRDRRSPSQSSTEPVPEAVLLRPRPSWSEYDTVRSFRIAVADVAHCSMNIDEQLIELAQRKHHLIDRTDIASVMTSGQWCRLLDHGLWLPLRPASGDIGQPWSIGGCRPAPVLSRWEASPLCTAEQRPTVSRHRTSPRPVAGQRWRLVSRASISGARANGRPAQANMPSGASRRWQANRAGRLPVSGHEDHRGGVRQAGSRQRHPDRPTWGRCHTLTTTAVVVVGQLRLEVSDRVDQG